MTGGVKIHGICVAKNESDLMEYSLRDKLSWCDFVYIYDNGSTDATWEIARRCAAADPERILLFRSDTKPFGDGLRGEVFNHFRSKARPGDWWCRADVDEFYAINPRKFLASVPKWHHVVWSVHVQYLFTEVDLARFEATGQSRIPEDLPRHYVANYSEPRFFRHRDRLVWNEKDAWPIHMGISTPRRIPVRHYQFRSPEQIERRLATRREAAAGGYVNFQHSQATDWREKIDPSSELHLDAGDGNFIIDEAALPPHIEPPLKRALKSLAHTLGIWP
jgi:glycosyltransferase involved in cell wall biosynthesis